MELIPVEFIIVLFMSHSGIVSKNHAFAVLCGSVLILSSYSETLLLPKDI